MQRDEKIDVHRWREFGEEITNTFAFIRQNLGGILRGLLFIAGPFLLLTAIVFVFVFQDYFSWSMDPTDSPFVDDGSLENRFWVVLLQYLFQFVAYSLVSIVIFEYIYLYVGSPTGTVPLSALWKRFRKDVFKLMLAKVVMVIMIVVSFFCLIFPGLLMYAGLSGVEMAIIQEKENPFSAIGKSFSLMGKYFWGTVLLALVLFVIESLVGLLFAILPSMLLALKDLAVVELEDSSGWGVAIKILSAFSQMITYMLIAIPSVGMGLRYYQCMEDRDGRMLKRRIRLIGRPEAEVNIFEEDEEY